MSNIVEPSIENIKKAVNIIKNGGVVVCPSDCNLGLAVDPWDDSAVKKTFEIKKRPATKPLTLFITDPKEWKTYAEINKETETEEMVDRIANSFWPGPLNIILRKSDKVPSAMVCGGESVSISCMGNTVLNELIKELSQPIAMTSANMAGQADEVLVDINIASQQVGDKVDLILKGEARGTTKSSTIIDLTGSPRIVRYGDITVEQLNSVLKNYARVE